MLNDHIAVLSDAIAWARLSTAEAAALLRRAGAAHDLLDWLTEPGQVRGRSVAYVVGFPNHREGSPGHHADPKFSTFPTPTKPTAEPVDLARAQEWSLRMCFAR